MLEIHRIFTASPAHESFLRERGLTRLDMNAAPRPAGTGARVAPQLFGEHCTECAAPDCHAVCDLYRPGRDGFCARFVDGIVACRTSASPTGLGFEMLARPRSMFLCVGHTLLLSPRCARFWTTVLLRAGALARAALLPTRLLPARHRWRWADRARGGWNRIPRLLNRLAARQNTESVSLILVLGNPAPQTLTVDLTVSGFGNSQNGRFFRRRLALPRGWTRWEAPVSDMADAIDFRKLFRIALAPQNESDVFLQIAWLGFVADGAPARTPGSRARAPKIKLAVFDLDGTLWSGILAEDGAAALTLKPGVRALLESLDARGILLSVASRNPPDEALRVLREMNLADLFLCPQIGPMPKSGSLGTLARTLGIGLDTVLFLDDSPFERAEVQATLPMVEVANADTLPGLAAHPRLQVAATPEAARRRELYRVQLQRQAAMPEPTGDLRGFLESCRQQLDIVALSDADRARAYELVQRTNRLNFSGVHYTRADLDRLLARPDTTPLVMRAADRFGEYGVAGFALLQHLPNRVLLVRDMMFSCRLQDKRFEAAFLRWCANAAAHARTVQCRYVPSERNRQAETLFAELGARRVAGQPDAASFYTIPPDNNAREPVDVRADGLAL